MKKVLVTLFCLWLGLPWGGKAQDDIYRMELGGGVGGCQAAVTARERGHEVILVEKTDRLGGVINFTDKDEDKVDLRNAKNCNYQ